MSTDPGPVAGRPVPADGVTPGDSGMSGDSGTAPGDAAAAPGDGGPAASGNAAAVNENAYPAAERAAVYRVIEERRDVRQGFLPDPVPPEVLGRVLAAAHRSPSVGLSQPWDFIVIRDRARRERIKTLAERAASGYAASLPSARATAFDRLKIEAILETPLNIVVTCDPTRGGRHTLGRQSQPQTAAYSSVLAVANLWLAARAEGLGVGWVSFFTERELAAELGLPGSPGGGRLSVRRLRDGLRPGAGAGAWPAGRGGGRWPGPCTRRSMASAGCRGRMRWTCSVRCGPRSARWTRRR